MPALIGDEAECQPHGERAGGGVGFHCPFASVPSTSCAHPMLLLLHLSLLYPPLCDLILPSISHIVSKNAIASITHNCLASVVDGDTQPLGAHQQ